MMGKMIYNFPIMWPTLISVGPLAIQSFGFLVFLGLFFGGFVWWKKGKEEGFEEEILMDHWLISGVVALILGRSWYILSHWQVFAGSVYKILFLTKFPGLSYEGVLIGAVMSLLILGKNKDWDLWSMLEVGVFSLLTVELFGMLGSFLGGSNLGKVTSWWWGIGFPGVEGRRHPVQILQLVLLFLVFQLFKKWEKEYRRFKWYQHGKDEAKPGFLAAMYLISIGLIRLGVGVLKDYNNVWFNVALILIGVLILMERSGIKIGLVKRRSTTVKEKSKERALKKRKKQGFDFK